MRVLVLVSSGQQGSSEELVAVIHELASSFFRCSVVYFSEMIKCCIFFLNFFFCVCLSYFRFFHEFNTNRAVIAGSRGSSLSVFCKYQFGCSPFFFFPPPPLPLPPVFFRVWPGPPPPLTPAEHLHQMSWTIGCSHNAAQSDAYWATTLHFLNIRTCRPSMCACVFCVFCICDCKLQYQGPIRLPRAFYQYLIALSM